VLLPNTTSTPSRSKPVADAKNRFEEVCGLTRLVQLLPQVLDVTVHRPFLSLVAAFLQAVAHRMHDLAAVIHDQDSLGHHQARFCRFSEAG
jgi:hypothetical protein